MLRRPPTFTRVPILDRRDSETLAEEAEARGEITAGRGADAKYAKYRALQTRQIGRNLDHLHLPTPGEVLFLLSQKDVNTFTLLLWIIEKAGRLDELFVTTFNVNQDIIRAFADLLDAGSVGTLSIVLSQSIESRMPERVEDLRQAWQDRQGRLRVAVCWNHSKIALAKTSDEACYVLTGSGNYSFNAEIEQYEVFQDAALYDFLRTTLERRCFSEARMNKRHKVWGVDA